MHNYHLQRGGWDSHVPLSLWPTSSHLQTILMFLEHFNYFPLLNNFQPRDHFHQPSTKSISHFYDVQGFIFGLPSCHFHCTNNNQFNGDSILLSIIITWGAMLNFLRPPAMVIQIGRQTQHLNKNPKGFLIQAFPRTTLRKQNKKNHLSLMSLFQKKEMETQKSFSPKTIHSCNQSFSQQILWI